MRSTGESPVDERPSVAPSLWSLSLHADTLSPIPLGDWIMVQENFVPLHGQPAQPGIAERWEQVRFQLRKHWPQLSNEDLSAIDGDSRKLIALVHQKTGADIREIESQIDTIAASSEGLLDRVNRTIQQAVASASDQVGEPLSQAYQATREQIVHAPGRSVGIAFAAGLLIGLGAASMIRDVQAPRRSFW
ncbi:MAG: hypothetical protein KDA45_12270 [Planctomycetales bacterium]|nr:hypothetical protein [Planctomycetales bacterium]